MKIKPGTLILQLVITYMTAMLFYHHSAWADSCGYNPNDLLAQQQEQCNQRSDSTWRCDVNRCMVSDEIRELEEAYSACDSMTGEAAAQCRIDVAKAETEKNSDVEIDQEKLSTNKFGMAVNSAIGTIYIMSGFGMKESIKCTAMSAKLIGAAGIINVVGSMLANANYRSKSKKLVEKYEELGEEGDPNKKQVEAFDYLAEEQGIKAKAAGNFKLANYAASGLYAAGAIMAAMGMFNPSESSPCGSGSSSFIRKPMLNDEILKLNQKFIAFEYHRRIFAGETASSISTDDYESLLDLSEQISFSEKLTKDVNEYLDIALNIVFPAAHAGLMSDLLPAAAGAGLSIAALVAIGGEAGTGLSGFIASPAGRVVFGSVGAGLSLMAGQKYAREQRKAKERQKAIEEMRDSLAERLGLDTCPERDDPAVPKCYCFVIRSEVNQERKNERICEEYLANNAIEFGDETDYTRYGPATDYSKNNGCVSQVTGQFQLNCECKATNTCAKAGYQASDFTLGPLNTALAGGVRDANNAANGNTNFATLEGGSASSGAFKLNKALGPALNEAASKLEKKGKKGFRLSDIKNATAAINKAIGPEGRKAASNFGGAINTPPIPAKYKKIVEDNFPEEKGRVAPKADRNTASSGSGFDFLNDGANSNGVIDGFKAEQNYKYGKKDINTKPDESIWKILTHRYHQSGLERLFQ